MKKIFFTLLSLSLVLSILLPIKTSAAFFKDKEVIYEIPQMKDDPIIKARKLSTHYRINKVTGMNVSFTKYVNGVLDINFENKTTSTSFFDDNRKYAVVDVEYIPVTVAWNSVTKKWGISTEIFFTKSDASAALTDFIFAPMDSNGKPWVLKIDDVSLVKKSKM